MPLIVITGPMGAGKTTVQRQLVEGHGARPVVSYTTRNVEPDEFATVQLDQTTLEAGVRDGSLLAPFHLAGAFYVWDRGEFERAVHGPATFVTTARPYTALLLASIGSGALPIFLTVDDVTLRQRRELRAEHRDTNPDTAQHRRRADAEEIGVFQRFFRHQVPADSDAPDRISEILLKHRKGHE